MGRRPRDGSPRSTPPLPPPRANAPAVATVATMSSSPPSRLVLSPRAASCLAACTESVTASGPVSAAAVAPSHSSVASPLDAVAPDARSRRLLTCAGGLGRLDSSLATAGSAGVVIARGRQASRDRASQLAEI